MADQFTIGVFTIVFDGEQRVLLVHRRDLDLWDLPGGGMEHGELPTETAIRETKEETGLDIEIIRLLAVWNKPAPEDDDIGFIFLCHAIGGEIVTSDESDNVCFFKLDELPDNVTPRKRYLIEMTAQNPNETIFVRVDLPHGRTWLEQRQRN